MMDLPAETPLAVAVVTAIQQGDVERLRRLFHDNAGLGTARIVDRFGVKRSLLHIVADWPGHFPNRAATVAILAAAGADVNAPLVTVSSAKAPETPLHWAASADDVEVLDALLDAEANIEASGAIFTGGTPMSDAVVFAQWTAARRLLERGAGTNLWQAAALGLRDRVQQYFAGEPYPSSGEITNAFWHACRGGQRPTAEVLLAHGADLNWIGHHRKTPFQAAQDSGAEEVIAWLHSLDAKLADEVP